MTKFILLLLLLYGEVEELSVFLAMVAEEEPKLPWTFKRIIEKRTEAINGLPFRNKGKGLVNFLLKGVDIIFRNKKKSRIKVVCLFAFYVTRLCTTQGVKGAVNNLKTCQVLLQQGVARYRVSDISELKTRVKRNRAGLPRIIPSNHRKLIREGDISIIRMWMTLFGIFRILSFQGQPSFDTITDPSPVNLDILDKDYKEFAEKEFFFSVGRWAQSFKDFVWYPKPVPIAKSSPTTGPFKTGYISTSWPSLTLAAKALADPHLRMDTVGDPKYRMIDSFHALEKISGSEHLEHFIEVLYWYAADGYYIFKPQLGKPKLKAAIKAILSRRKDYSEEAADLIIQAETLRSLPLDNPNRLLASDDVLQIRDMESASRYLHSREPEDIFAEEKMRLEWMGDWGDKFRAMIGKLSLKYEAAGKVRVFAMVDAWTQWLLKPLHDAIFALLRGIPQDGTHDQLKPIYRLIEKAPAGESFYSIDLKAATDRLPIRLQEIVLSQLFRWAKNETISQHCIEMSRVWRDILVRRLYGITYVTREPKWVPNVEKRQLRNVAVVREQGYVKVWKKHIWQKFLKYAVGQPMGALSSWAMLAITHHFIVQFAYKRVCLHRGVAWRWYSLYAILGDDIVIVNKDVALSYLNILKEIGVKAGLAKSIISDGKVVLEFAKKFFVDGEPANMVPYKEIIASAITTKLSSTLALKYDLEYSRILRFYGYGYKVLGNAHKKLWSLGQRHRVFLAFLHSPDGAFNREHSLLHWLTLKSHLDNFAEIDVPWYLVFQAMTKEIASVNTAIRNKKFKVLDQVQFAQDHPTFDLTEKQHSWFADLFNNYEIPHQFPSASIEVDDPDGPTQKSVFESNKDENLYSSTLSFLYDLESHKRQLAGLDSDLNVQERFRMPRDRGSEERRKTAYEERMAPLLEPARITPLWELSETPFDNVKRAYKHLKELDDAFVKLSAPGQQLRSDEEDEFDNIIRIYKRWVSFTRPLWAEHYHGRDCDVDRYGISVLCPGYDPGTVRWVEPTLSMWRIGDLTFDLKEVPQNTAAIIPVIKAVESLVPDDGASSRTIKETVYKGANIRLCLSYNTRTDNMLAPIMMTRVPNERFFTPSWEKMSWGLILMDKFIRGILREVPMVILAVFGVVCLGLHLEEGDMRSSSTIPDPPKGSPWLTPILFLGYCGLFLTALYFADVPIQELAVQDGTEEALRVVGRRLTSLVVPRQPEILLESPIRMHGYHEFIPFE